MNLNKFLEERNKPERPLSVQYQSNIDETDSKMQELHKKTVLSEDELIRLMREQTGRMVEEPSQPRAMGSNRFFSIGSEVDR